jgi:hypothetical protein
MEEVRGDQEARDDEEDVDADVAAGQAVRPEVEQQDGTDGDRPQALDVGANDGAAWGR